MTTFAQLVIHNRDAEAGGGDSCVANNGFCPSWIVDNFDRYLHPFWQHVYLSVIAVVAGFLIAFGLALLAHRRHWLVGPIIGVTGVLYTLPSIAVFFLLQPITGRGALTALIALTAYTLLILFRNIITGLQNVPVDAIDAARGLGYTDRQVLWRVELPLAVPEIIAGLRIAATTTVGLATLAFFAGAGGLGGEIFADITFKSNVVTAGVLCLLLAILFDLVLLGIQRLLTPWMRALPMERRRRWMLWRTNEAVTA
jgi:osmoprotectant transport system permease protein